MVTARASCTIVDLRLFGREGVHACGGIYFAAPPSRQSRRGQDAHPAKTTHRHSDGSAKRDDLTRHQRPRLSLDRVSCVHLNNSCRV